MSGAKPDEFAAAEREARERGREAQAELEAALASLHALREAERQGAAALDAAKAELQSARSEFLTVEAVQKAALGKGAAEHLGMARWPQARCEPAARAAARGRRGLGARCRNRARQLPRGGLRRRNRRGCGVPGHAGRGPADDRRSTALPSGPKPDAESLAARVAGPAVVTGLLGGVIAVESLANAMSRRKSLQPGQSVIARNGIWLGRDWVRVARSEAGHAGVIAREQELKALHEAVTGQESRVAELEGKLAETRSAARRAGLEPRRSCMQRSTSCTTTSSTCAVRTRRSGRRPSRSRSGLRV